MLHIDDLIQTDGSGKGVVNILVADKLMNALRLYLTLLLWMLSELFERLPEVGDLDKSKLVFSLTKRTCCLVRHRSRCCKRSNR